MSDLNGSHPKDALTDSSDEDLLRAIAEKHNVPVTLLQTMLALKNDKANASKDVKDQLRVVIEEHSTNPHK